MFPLLGQFKQLPADQAGKYQSYPGVLLLAFAHLGPSIPLPPLCGYQSLHRGPRIITATGLNVETYQISCKLSLNQYGLCISQTYNEKTEIEFETQYDQGLAMSQVLFYTRDVSWTGAGGWEPFGTTYILLNG